MAGLESSKIILSDDFVDLEQFPLAIRDSLSSSVRYNGSDYLLTSSSKTWEAAQAEAQQLGGNLVTINDAAEDSWLRENFGQDEGFWMGLSDKDQEGEFKWASGEAVDYTNWAAGEPNDYNGNQDYGRTNFGSYRQWDDEHDTTELRGIIEIDVNAPEPMAPSTPITTEPTNDDATYGDSRYVVIDESLTWEAAQAKAEEMGGNLVTINDAAEDAWLQQAFGHDEGFWMGLSDRTQEGSFQWASGEDVTYTNWAPGEPNDYNGTQDYGRTNFGNNRQWDDEHDYTTLKSIVEIKSNSEPVIDPVINPSNEELGPTLPEGEGTGGNPESVDGSLFYNGSRYVLTQYNTWDGAQAEAQQLGGNLVTINDAAEDEWLQEAFGRDQDLWMGATDRDQEGNFQWVSGEDSTYSNWAPGEPNDWRGNQDYGRINYGDSRQWDDDQESTIRQGIVEIKYNDEVSVPPTPLVTPTSPTPSRHSNASYTSRHFNPSHNLSRLCDLQRPSLFSKSVGYLGRGRS